MKYFDKKRNAQLVWESKPQSLWIVSATCYVTRPRAFALGPFIKDSMFLDIGVNRQKSYIYYKYRMTVAAINLLL